MHTFVWKKNTSPRNDGIDMVCTIFDSKLPKVLFNVSGSLREGKNINKRRKWQTPPMVVEAEVHENYYSEVETDNGGSDTEVSHKDVVLDREYASSQGTRSHAILSIFSDYESKRNLNLTTDKLDCDNILVKQENDPVLNTVPSWI